MASEYQKRLLKTQQDRVSKGITMSNPSGSSSNKSSSNNKKVIGTSVVGNVITDYYSDGTSRTVETTGKVGSATPKETAKLKEISPSRQAVIGGKVYSGATPTEVLNNKLSPYTQAKFLPSQTAQRNQYVNSYAKIQAGKGTSTDLINVLSGGKGAVEDILTKYIRNNQGEVIFSSSRVNNTLGLANKNELERFKSEVFKQMSNDQKRFYNTLSQTERGKYLIQVASRRLQPVQITRKIIIPTKNKQLSKVSNAIASKLEDWGKSIEKRESASKRKEAVREAKRLANLLKTKEDIDKLFFKGSKTISKLLVSFSSGSIKLAEGFTIGYIKSLASAGEKAIFLLPALGQSVSRGDIARFGKEFVTDEQKQVLKEIYTDPKTYLFAIIGAGLITILGGVKSGKLTAKSVRKLPKTTKSFNKGNILIDSKGNLGYVSKSGLVRPVPKGLNGITRALTKNVVKPKLLSKTRAGNIYRGFDGKLRIETKGGKVRILTQQQARKAIIEIKAKSKLRAKVTEKARTVAKAKSEAIKSSKLSLKTSKILKARAKEINLRQIQREINIFTKRFNVKGARKTEFTKAYKKYRLNPTDKNANILKRISDKIEVDKGVRLIDTIIKRDLAKIKSTPKTIKKTPKQTLKGKLSEYERLLVKGKLSKAKVKEYLKLKKQIKQVDRFQARIKADNQAQSKGFKNYEEQFRYEKAFREYTRGNPRAERILKAIENKLSLRKSAKSKLRAKQIEAQRVKLYEDAIKSIRKGRLALKEQVKPSKIKVRSKSKLSRSDIIKTAKEVETKLKVKSNLKSEPSRVINSGRQQLVQRTKPKLKIKRVQKTIKQLKTPRLARATTITSALVVSQGILNKTNKRLNFAESRFSELSPSQTSSLIKALTLDLRQLQNLNVDLSNLQRLGTDLTSIQSSELAQDQAQLLKQESKLAQVLKTIKKSKPTKKQLKETPIILLPPLPKLNWNTKLPRGYNFIVNARYKKGNKIYTRPLRTTPNRARKIMNSFIDNNIRVSYDLVIVGAKKIKDINKPSMKKFTTKKGRDPKVRINVEKIKYRIDRPKEKRQLKTSRRKAKVIKRRKKSATTRTKKRRK